MADEDAFTRKLGSTLERLREMLVQLGASALVQQDPNAAALYAALARCEDPEAFAIALDRLADRIDELAVPANPADSLTARRIAGAMRQSADTLLGAAPRARTRTFLKL